MRVPVGATPEVQQAIRELHRRIDQFIGNPNAGHPNVKGKRVTNAGDAVADTDLVTKQQVNDVLDRAGLPLIGDTFVATPADLVAAAGDSSTGGGEGDPGTCNATKPDFTAYVAAAKATLIGLAEDLTGPCGAFKIIRLAARNIQAVDNTVGCLAKTGGNHCDYNGQGYSTDIITFIDGAQYDALQGAGDGDGITTGNTPTWTFVLCGDPTLYRGVPP
jgi:hypothetical protein